jgi:subtilisin family serine protease
MTEEQTIELAAQAAPDNGGSSAAESPTSLLDTVTSEGTATEEGQDTSAQPEGSNEPVQQDASAWTFTAPEGTNVDVGSSPVRALGEAAAQEGLSNEQAQKVLDQVGPAFTQHYQQLHQQMMEQWAAETKQHPEIGGAKLQQSLTEAKQAFATFDPEGHALQVLTEWGLVNHPAILGFAKRVRGAISDGRFVAGQSRDEAPQSTARSHFPGSDLND